MSNKKVEENGTMDIPAVYTMFEDIQASQTKQLKLIEEIRLKPAHTPTEAAPTPVLDPEDGERIEMLTEKLDRVNEKLDRPLRHNHIIDFMGNRALIAIVATIATLFVSLYFNHNQRQTLAQFRDNDLKYRYIQMRGEATPGDILQLRNVFDFNRNSDSIKLIQRQVERYEQLILQQAENETRARLNASEAQRLNTEAEQIKKK